MGDVDRRTLLKALGAGAAGLGASGLLGRPAGAEATGSGLCLPEASATAPLGSVDAAVVAVSRGELVVVVGDEDRGNQGALILAAERATTEALAFIVRHTSGLVSVGMTGDRLDALDLPLMRARYSDGRGTAFTVSVDYRPGTTSGVSAADRAATIRALVDDTTEPSDFARPGHVFPLRARPGGVLQRASHTEAAVDLARLASLKPAGVLSEVVNDDGTLARGSQLLAFAARHDLATISIDQLIAYRRRQGALT